MLVLDEEFTNGTPFRLTVQRKECVENDTCGTAKLIDAPFFEESSTEFSLPGSLQNNNSTPYIPPPHEAHNTTLSLPYNGTASVCAALDEIAGYNYYKLSGSAEGCIQVSVYSRFQSSIGILHGDCTSLSCLAHRRFWSDNGDPSLKFFKESETDYTIAVGSNSRQGGHYIIIVEVSLVAVLWHTMH